MIVFITISYIFGVIYWNHNQLYDILWLPPVASIYAVLWEKYRRCRVNRARKDDEAVVGLMDEDEELEDTMQSYGVELRDDEGLGLRE
jgi:hypothetical protein